MNTSKKIRSLIVAVAGILVASYAVTAAAASVNSARKASALVDGQRRIRIMITPAVAHNDINLAQKQKGIDVAIIGENGLPFSDIDVQTVEFAGAIPAKTSTKSTDVDQDGIDDRTYTFTTNQLKLTPADTMACLKAETVQKVKMSGCDKVKVIPAKSPY